ncbi:unnamed protein product [Didymodactylos carnosus]|uniref:Uncharacterized protein n=1 Tax=Didymodactylos carnosus TaxID=1234261 RepID=A0A815V2P0_9BILA|nr:unnamed protein product [Didymodactylos carnosus]CAF4389745.1 unnamed protein product [Didymodactylos carnosus]
MFDTVGVCESSEGTIPTKIALEKFDKLLKSLYDGIHLLLFCIRIGRLTQTTKINYKLFVNELCDNKVPCILLITHCESEDQMGLWWDKNKNIVKKQLKYDVRDGISVTTKKSGKHACLEEYELSRINLLKAISEYALPKPWDPNTMIRNFYGFCKKVWCHASSHVSTHDPFQQYLEEPRTEEVIKRRNPPVQRAPPIRTTSETATYIGAQENTFQRHFCKPNIVILVDAYTCSKECFLVGLFENIINELNTEYPGLRSSSSIQSMNSVMELFDLNSTQVFDLDTGNVGAVTYIGIYYKEIHNNEECTEAIQMMRKFVETFTDRFGSGKKLVITTNPYSSSSDLLKDYNDSLVSPNVDILRLDFGATSFNGQHSNMDESNVNEMYTVLKSYVISLLKP